MNLPIMAADSTKKRRDQKAAKALRPVVMSAMFMLLHWSVNNLFEVCEVYVQCEMKKFPRKKSGGGLG